MIVLDETIKNSQIKKKHPEIKLNARAVSRGVAIGTILCLHGRKRQFYRVQLKKSQIAGEIRRFNASVRLAKRHLKKNHLQKNESLGENTLNIFETHLLILDDRSLLDKIETNIKEKKVNAEWAVKTVTDEYVAKCKAIADEHLRDKYIDVEDIADRILTALGGGRTPYLNVNKDSIIVAKEVRPSTLIELAGSKPKAIITENGGWTSHTFILARELNLPAVTGVKGILRRVETGEKALVDGYHGQIIINPTDKTLCDYDSALTQFQTVKSDKIKTFNGRSKTLDGREIIIRANLDLLKGYAKANGFGAQGIGLYRSEFLFNQYKGYPSENEQITAYRKIAEFVGAEGVKIRTFDLSIDNLVDEATEKEKNPALGLRAIRLSLKREDQFRTQLRAILQASAGNKIDLVLPMISDISEIREARKILVKERANLLKKKINCGAPRLGIMIEVPASVLFADEIAKEVDFLCLGTNDLVQYLLAVDRDNELVADWFRTLHPAVIRAIKFVLEAGEKNSIPVIICGEMAGSPFYVPILIGLGAQELSMNVNSIPQVKKVIAGIAFEEAREIVRKIEKCLTSDEIEAVIHACFLEKWAHLFSDEISMIQKKNKINKKF